MSAPPQPPTHLSVFVTDPETGNPVQRLPIYAEIAVPRLIEPRPPASERLREAIQSALGDVDPATTGAKRSRLLTVSLAALGQEVEDAALEDLIADLELTRGLFQRVYTEALAQAGKGRFTQITENGWPELIAAAIRKVAGDMGITLVENGGGNSGTIWAEPLGVLTTDHVGYVSFDLTRVRPDVLSLLAGTIAARRADPAYELDLAIWIYPYGHDGRHEVLAQARFAFDAIVARIEMIWHTLPPALINMGPRALQNPSLTDWRLSPASFAASPKTLVGADGCEELVPSNLALQQFVLRQIVRIADPVPEGFNIPAAAGFKAAYIDEYKVSWFGLGHSLGEILYSLPLAPGETVKLAVIDWSWDSLSKRDETTKLDESLTHQTHRDRTITETVKAGVRELQHGSSFMGGMANAVGGSVGANLGMVGIGGAVGNTWSLGGSTATSEGSRDVAADMVQKVSDSFSQASSVQREINSTVVVQATQAQKEAIETRTFSNYNHSHTLTVLYYEVLRHFRVTVEWVRRRRAVLAKIPARVVAPLTDAIILDNRFLLEANLLDAALKPGFDALEKREAIANHHSVHGINPAAPVPAPWWEGDVELELFEIGIWTNDNTVQPIVAYIITAGEHARSKRYELHYVYKGSGSEDYTAHDLNSGDRMETDQEQYTFVKIQGQAVNGESVRIKWRDIIGFQFEKWGDTDWRIDFLSIKGWDRFGFQVDFTPGKIDVNLFIRGVQPGSQTFSAIKRPGPLPPPPPPPPTPERALSLEESYQIKKLKAHFDAHIDHYATLLQFAAGPDKVAVQFEKTPWTSGFMDDHVEPAALDVFGSYVAYPLARQEAGVDDTTVVDLAAALNGADPAARQKALDQIAAMNDADRASVLTRLPLATARSERLISLPTRGVFAEGKLGHCNVSEVIDDTRFWKWEEHPIPINAPEIAPTTPISPKPEQVSTTPTQFPQAVVSISNPGSLPDPTGLAAALGLLGKSDIFRDMSGQKEVADLLKKLAQGSIDIAEAARKAQEIQAKYGTDLDKQQKDYDKAVAELAAKERQAQADREPPAAGTKAAAEAKKANVEAAVQQAEAAKKLPASMQAPVYEAAANALAGNPVKSKSILFKALAYDRQRPISGKFGLTLRDVVAQKDLIAEPAVEAVYGKQQTFATANPNVRAIVTWVPPVKIWVANEEIALATAAIIDAANDTLPVEPDHTSIDINFVQSAQDIGFEATSTDEAATKLKAQWGTQFGVADAALKNIIEDYEKANGIVHVAGEEKTYKLAMPTNKWVLTVSSK